MFGINGASPGEVLHMLQKGIFHYCIVGFFKSLTDMPKEFVDKRGKEVSSQLCGQSDREYPRLSFPLPLSVYTQLQAHEVPGVMLVLVVTLYCHACWVSDDPNSLGSSAYVDVKKVEEFRYLFEHLLCFEQWYKQERVHKRDLRNGKALSSIRVCMKKVVKILDRQEGEGLKITKFHSLLHTVDDMLQFGSTQNFHSGPGESSHKDNVKRHAKRTQGRKAKLEQQTAVRQCQSLVLQHARHLVDQAHDLKFPVNDPTIEETNRDVGGTRFVVTLEEDENVSGDYVILRKFRWASTHSADHPRHMPPANALNFLAELVASAASEHNFSLHGIDLSCFCEHKRQGHMFRAHPDYRREGPRYEWVYYQYYEPEKRKPTELPARIWCFLDLREPLLCDSGETQVDIRAFLAGWTGPGTYAVVTSMEKVPSRLFVSHALKGRRKLKKKATKEEVERCTSVLLWTGSLHTELLLIPTDSFTKPAMVVENFGRNSDHSESLIVVRPRSEWAALFC